MSGEVRVEHLVMPEKKNFSKTKGLMSKSTGANMAIDNNANAID